MTRLAALIFAAACVGLCIDRAAAAVPPPSPAREVCVAWDDTAADSVSKLSKSRAKNIERLLSRSGQACDFIPASELAAKVSPRHKVLHIVMFTVPNPARAATLKKYAAGGGKIVAWGCSASDVASLFGVKVASDKMVPPSKGGAWTSFEFTGARPLHAPESVSNRAAMIYRVTVVSKSSQTIATWKSDSSPERLPAVVKSSNGYFITRVLYDDGDAAARERLVLSLSATLAPSIWKNAALSLEREIWSRFGAVSAADAEKKALSASPSSQADIIRACFFRMKRTDAEKNVLFSQGLYGAAMAKLWDVSKQAHSAYAAMRPRATAAKKGRFCVWEPTGYGPVGAGSWEAIAPKLASAGVTDLFLFAGSPAGTVTPVAGLPLLPDAARRGDPFPSAVAACAKCGIRVHAWFCALRFENPDELRKKAYVDARRTLHDAKGNVLPWLDPQMKVNREEIAKAVASLASKKGIAGVNLDFVRYPDGATREKKASSNVDALVSLIKTRVRAVAPKCEISASVYGRYPLCSQSVGQNWGSWLRAKTVDRVIPMNYTSDIATLRRFASDQKPYRSRALCGLGFGSNEAMLSPEQTIDEILEADRLGYPGVALFSLDNRFLDELVPVLQDW